MPVQFIRAYAEKGKIVHSYVSTFAHTGRTIGAAAVESFDRLCQSSKGDESHGTGVYAQVCARSVEEIYGRDAGEEVHESSNALCVCLLRCRPRVHHDDMHTFPSSFIHLPSSTMHSAKSFIIASSKYSRTKVRNGHCRSP